MQQNVNTNSRPSDLKITDMRIAMVSNWPLLRIDTNQGIYGLGEVRDGASKNYALMIKSRILGENPCDVDRLFRKIKQFGNHGRQGGGVSGIEIALMDLAGKAYNVPVYQLLGGKFRDTIRIYCDSPSLKNAVEMGNCLKDRMNRGFTFLKMDAGLQLCRGIPGAIQAPAGMLTARNVAHPFTHIHITEKGLEVICQYVETVRGIIGYEIPLSVDHIGRIGLQDSILLARALGKYRLAWLEDLIPWQYTEQYVRLSTACETPICTGEDIYLKEGFMDLLKARAVAVIHPDLVTAGGIMETKKIGDLAQAYQISMAMHNAGSPISIMANVHCAAATENFIALEHHSVDNKWWEDLVTGIPKPIVQNGFINVPNTPGLGVSLNEDAVKEHLNPEDPGYFQPTSEWDKEHAFDWIWS